MRNTSQFSFEFDLIWFLQFFSSYFNLVLYRLNLNPSSLFIHFLVPGVEKQIHPSVHTASCQQPLLVLPNCCNSPFVTFTFSLPFQFHPRRHDAILTKPPLTSLLPPPKAHPHSFLVSKFGLLLQSRKTRLMADWAPVLVGVVLFVLLQPGLLFALPGNGKQLEFGAMKTNGKAIFIHSLIFFALYAILLLAVRIHIYTG